MSRKQYIYNMLRKLLVLVLVFQNISCKRINQVTILHPEEFLIEGGFWCFDGDIHDCFTFKRDSIYYFKDLRLYKKTPYKPVSYDTINKEFTFSDLNNFESNALNELLKDVESGKLDKTRLNGINIFKKIYIINNNQIGIKDITLKNGQINIENPIYGFTKLKSLSNEQRSK